MNMTQVSKKISWSLSLALVALTACELKTDLHTHSDQNEEAPTLEDYSAYLVEVDSEFDFDTPTNTNPDGSSSSEPGDSGSTGDSGGTETVSNPGGDDSTSGSTNPEVIPPTIVDDEGTTYCRVKVNPPQITPAASTKAKGKSKVMICHYPPGNPNNAHTLVVGEAAVSAHLKHHHDTLGACAGYEDGDPVYGECAPQ